MIQCNDHPRKSLHILWVARRNQLLYGLYLIQIHLNSSIRDHVPQEFSNTYTECTFVGVKAKLVSPVDLKCLSQVCHMISLLPAFYYHIVDINLHCTPNLISKHSCYHLLINGPHILQPKGYHCVMVVFLRSYS